MSANCIACGNVKLCDAADNCGMFAFAWWLTLVTAIWYLCAWRLNPLWWSVTTGSNAQSVLMHFLWYGGVGIAVLGTLALLYLWYAFFRLLNSHFYI